MSNPMTTTGDMIYASNTAAPSTPARLGIGIAGQCMVVSGGLPSWGTCPSGSASVAGSNGQVQFNNAGAFGADAAFSWDNTDKTLSIAQPLWQGTYVPLVLRNTPRYRQTPNSDRMILHPNRLLLNVQQYAF